MRAILRSPSEYWPELQRDMALRIDLVLLLLTVLASTVRIRTRCAGRSRKPAAGLEYGQDPG